MKMAVKAYILGWKMAAIARSTLIVLGLLIALPASSYAQATNSSET